MNRHEKILAAIACVLAIVVGLLWLKPDILPTDWKAGKYSDTRALVQSDLGKLDLIPAWLPASATGLKLTQNIDSGAGFLFFQFTETDLAGLREVCPRILKPLPELPKQLEADWKPANPDAFYLCPKNTMLAIDGKQRSALLWR